MSTSVRPLSPAATAARVRAGNLTLIDVRPPEERALAAVPESFAALEDGGLEHLLALPRDRPLAFLCHHGARSAQAAEYFRAHGFGEIYNVEGGIEAWALDVDADVPRY